MAGLDFWLKLTLTIMADYCVEVVGMCYPWEHAFQERHIQRQFSLIKLDCMDRLLSQVTSTMFTDNSNDSYKNLVLVVLLPFDQQN